MAVAWTPDERDAVEAILKAFPAQSGRCFEAARGVLPFGRARDPARSHWHHVQTDYEHFIAAHFPGAPPTTLAVLVDQEPSKLIPLLVQFVAEQRRIQSSGDSVQNRYTWEVAMIESIMAKMRAVVENEREKPETYHFRPVNVTDKVA